MMITRVYSPNFDARDESVPLRHIVLHYTGMKGRADALARLCDPAAKVSAHYVIGEHGRIYNLVDEDKRAWHAGESCWRDVRDMNSASIGIELVNPGHQNGYRPFPLAQIASLRELVQDILRRRNLPPATSLLGHSDIAPARKEDPGELFPWRALAADELGLWPAPVASDYAPAGDGDVQSLLRAIGYDCPDSGAYDRQTRAALLAFQRRYEPDNLTGTPERETVARLRALKRVLGI